MNLDEYRKSILEIPVIKELSPEIRSGMAMIILWIAHESDMFAGEVVYSQGTDDEDTGCVLLNGKVAISKEEKDVMTCDAPDILGEMKQFTKGKQRTATVKVMTNSTVLMFYWQDFVIMAERIFDKKEQRTVREVISKLAGHRFLEQEQKLSHK